MIKHYVTIHEIDTKKVRASKSLAKWVEDLEDGVGGSFSGELTWDAVFACLVWEYIIGGDYAEYVTEKVSDFASMPAWLKIA